MQAILNLQFTFNCENVTLTDEELSDELDNILSHYIDGRYNFLPELLSDTSKRLFENAIKMAIERKFREIYNNEMVQITDTYLKSKALIEAENEIEFVKVYDACCDIDSSVKFIEDV
jgi:nitrate/nitrite-specific signal transduction histidine kinase